MLNLEWDHVRARSHLYERKKKSFLRFYIRISIFEGQTDNNKCDEVLGIKIMFLACDKSDKLYHPSMELVRSLFVRL